MVGDSITPIGNAVGMFNAIWLTWDLYGRGTQTLNSVKARTSEHQLKLTERLDIITLHTNVKTY